MSDIVYVFCFAQERLARDSESYIYILSKEKKKKEKVIERSAKIEHYHEKRIWRNLFTGTLRSYAKKENTEGLQRNEKKE